MDLEQHGKSHGKSSGYIDTGFVAGSQIFIDELERITNASENPSYHNARLEIFKRCLGGLSVQKDCFWYDMGTFDDYAAAKTHAKVRIIE